MRSRDDGIQQLKNKTLKVILICGTEPLAKELKLPDSFGTESQLQKIGMDVSVLILPSHTNP